MNIGFCGLFGANSLHPLKSEESLDFLQRFMTDFENRYARQFNRYCKQRSRPKAISQPPGFAPQDEPF